MKLIYLLATLILWWTIPFDTVRENAPFNQDIQTILNAQWLIGTWENKTTRGSIYETWSKFDAQSLVGQSYRLNGTDTIVFEHIAIRQSEDRLFYIPQVMDQNDGAPVSFEATTVSSTHMIFENPKHDFPQLISYRRITADSLVAEISGLVNGEVKRRQFPMKRLK